MSASRAPHGEALVRDAQALGRSAEFVQCPDQADVGPDDVGIVFAEFLLLQDDGLLQQLARLLEVPLL